MNTMKGMPGRIKVAGGCKNILKGPHVEPHKGGPIGSKSGAHRANDQRGAGTTAKSYRATSTGHPGRVERLVGHAKMSTEK
jgi:hypothetical protein